MGFKIRSLKCRQSFNRQYKNGVILYHIIGFCIFIFLVFSVFKDKVKNNNYLLLIITSILFILASIRYNIGTDYPAYYNFFVNIKPFNFNPDFSIGCEHYELLFRYTVSILKNIIISPIFYFSFWASVTLAFVWKGIKEQSENYLLSIFIFYNIFYVNYLFNALRQGIVMGIFLFSTKYIIERKFKSVLIISIIATLLHTSGIFILLAYFFSKIKIKNRFILILIIPISIFIWKFGLGEKLFCSIAQFFPDFIQQIIFVYVIKFFYPLTILNFLQRLLILIPLIFFYPKLSDDDTFRILFPVYYWGCVFYLLLGFFGLFIARINMFFRMTEVILIPILYERVKTRNQKLVVLFVIMCWCFTVLSWVYFKEAYYPFKTIF